MCWIYEHIQIFHVHVQPVLNETSQWMEIKVGAEKETLPFFSLRLLLEINRKLFCPNIVPLSARLPLWKAAYVSHW